ncbi:MAG TPA: hypothetical protein VNX65_04580 [Patescibacteria group bacterium]|nr:hypothetical protein [Patescibacteria group bacterium]
MKTDKSSETGFVVQGIMISLVVVAVLGFASWQSNRSRSSASTRTVQNEVANKPGGSTIQPKTTTAKKTVRLVIAEWGVELTPAAELNNLTVKPTSQPDEMMFMTDDMQKLAPTCSGTAQGSRPLGAINRSHTELLEPSNNKFIKKIKDEFYYYYVPAAACSPDNNIATMQYKNLDRVKASLDSMRAIE